MTRHAIPEQTRMLQASAADPGQSVWVSANAGSGKTHVLSRRVIRLLLGGADPARILCLTYTRTAAANMANKIFEDLAAWATMSDAQLTGEILALDGRVPDSNRLARARRLFARALETPGGLKIQTIHAFCEAVLHQFPLEANIAGHFELIDAAMEARLMDEARRHLLDEAIGGDDAVLRAAFDMVLALGGEQGFDELMTETVANRDKISRVLARQEADGGTAQALHNVLLGNKPALPPLLPDPYFTVDFARAYGDIAVRAGKKRATQFAATLAAALHCPDPDEAVRQLASLFCKKGSKAGELELHEARHYCPKGVIDVFPEFPAEFARFGAALIEACDRLATRDMIAATEAAMVLAARLIARYERLKNARGLLDFNDLIVRTVELLSRPDAGAWVQYKLDRGLDHILLDEAQDTSPDQWQVVRRLAEEFFSGEGARAGTERTIFAVGDEKQSIYSFQGAEPAAFAETGIAFGERIRAARGRFERIQLRHSFRSVSDVLNAVDRVFSDPERRKGLTRFDDPIEHPAIRATDPGHVEIWPLIAPNPALAPEDWTEPVDHASAPAAQLAAAVADRIAAWISRGDMLPGRGRRLRPGDIMVLVRKRDSFIHALTRALKERQVAVAGADRLRLGEHIAVQDLIALGRFVLQPEDDLSLAALLRSPIFNLSEETLFEIAHGRGRRSLWRNLLRKASDSPQLESAARRLAQWRREAGFHAPYEFYARLLGRDGVRAALVARLGGETGEILDEFENFLLAAERAGVTGLATLLENLITASPEIRREIDQGRDEVRIMTVHSAKGLEAPVVFLVDNGSKPFDSSHLPRLIPASRRGDDAVPEYYLWRADSSLRNRASAALEREIAERQEEEYRRLLYVGMTRAEDRLILCGYHGKSGPAGGTWHAMVSAGLADVARRVPSEDPRLDGEILHFSVTPVIATPASEAEDSPASRETAFPPELRTPLPPETGLPRPLTPSRAGAFIETDLPGPVPRDRSPVLDPALGRGIALERGAAIHRLLQHLPDIEPDGREALARRYLERAGAAWPEGEAERIWRSVAAVLDDPRLAPLLSPASRAEVTIAGHLRLHGERRAVTGRIDRLAVHADGVLFVDYKTGRTVPRQLTDIPAEHIAQVALYRALLARIYPDRPVEAGLVYTEGPQLYLLPGTLLDKTLEQLGIG